MDNNINLKELWKKQDAEQIPASAIQSRAKNFQRSVFMKTAGTTLLLAMTSAFIIWIWLHYQPQMLSTKLGISLIILAMGMFGYNLNRQYPMLKKMDAAESSQDYLHSLIALKKKQFFLQTTILNIYFITLSIGLALYMYEYTVRMTVWGALAAYVVTAIWILFCWFYLRPRQISKQQSKLDELINKFEGLNQQLNESD